MEPMRIHVKLDEEGCKIFDENRKNQVFTPQQLIRFDRSRKVYREHLHEFKN